jgi:glycosyltransferase involved in cell wall biosynthesis
MHVNHPARLTTGTQIATATPTVGLTVLTTAHDIADSRLHRHVNALNARDVSVGVIASGLERNAPHGAAQLRLLKRRGGLNRVVAALVEPLRIAGPLMVIDPEAIPAAWFATRLRRTALVVDLHEDYLAVSRDRPWAIGPLGRLARGLLRAVYAAASRAELTLVADDHLPPYRARRRLVVRNLPSPDPLGTVDTPLEPLPRAIYIGDLRPSRGVWTMLDAIAGAPEWSLDLVGPLNEVATEDFGRRVVDLGLVGRVRWHGRLPPDEAWALAKGAWCGLALLDPTPAYQAAMPTKVYEYLACGIPVLATPLPRVAHLLAWSDAGRIVADARDATATLRHWSRHPAAVLHHRSAAHAWARTQLAGQTPFDDAARAIRDVLTIPRGKP